MEEYDNEFQELTIADRIFTVEIAENDFNSDKKTLFATFVWNGSKILAEHLIENGESILKGSSVVEFGSAAGLPSLAAISVNAKNVTSTDYPCALVLDVLGRNIDRAKGSYPDVHTSILPHKWGEDVSGILQANNGEQYDVALAAECLWRHECHESLIQSIKNVLRIGGKAYVAFSNHIPGLEKDDMMFFEIASRYGLQTIDTKSFQAPHMWSDRMATIYLYTLQLMH